ncbi:hypothetical protein yc1106_10046 [Curvularia clavata]|uniref:Uncharacterized protein n=1 Tax=Curvularia clavata TaxID=95742 RepID=A0A9Q8ZIV5_CURCL|nr:hypothetical protein yc1106_10046 [Curvularia clavata]
MHFTQLFALAASATLAIAAPAPDVVPAAKPAGVRVTADDVVLTGHGGRYQVMKRSEFEKHFAEDLAVSRKPAHLEDGFITYTGQELANVTSSHLSKRDVSVIVPGKKERFVGWDVQVSQIIKGGPGTKITISSGFTIGNSVSVKVGTDLTLVENFMSVSMDVTQSWETSETQTETFFVDVPEGKFGCWVHQAWTNRQYGKVWKGKVGSAGEVDEWFADSFEPKTYGQMAWVNGYFSPCFQDTFPMKRCHGEGDL